MAEALAHEPDLLNMGPSYVNAIAYTYASIGGYLRMRADRDVVMIVIGDHQPAAAVSGRARRGTCPCTSSPAGRSCSSGSRRMDSRAG